MIFKKILKYFRVKNTFDQKPLAKSHFSGYASGFCKGIYSSIYNLLENRKINGVFAFILWNIIDFYRFIRDRKVKKPHLYGIYGYFGLWGQGKTISMVEELYSLRQKYNNDIYIFTTF